MNHITLRNMQIESAIKKHGIIIHGVSNFAYSTGMTNYGLPEIIITTMSQRTQAYLINHFFHKWLEEGVDLKSVEPMFEKRDGSDALMKFEKLSVSGELTDKYVCQTIAYYQENFHLAQNGVSFVQLVFADHNDHYPDHPEYDHKGVPQKTFKKLTLN